ncbi:MAG: methyl-accepting chemotaxis protein [Bacillota bacterium]|nr:methyl-accepting chemotaxis protein [Bacillota bacterium]
MSIMNMFNNINVSKRIVSGFLFLAVLTGIIGLVGIIQLNKIDNSYTESYKHNTAPLEFLQEASNNFDLIRISLLYMAADNTKANEFLSKISDYDKKIEKSLNDYEELILTESGRIEFQKLKTNLDSYNKYRREYIDYISTNQINKALDLTRNDLGRYTGDVSASFVNLLKIKNDLSKDESEKNNKSSQKSIIAILIIMGVSIIIAIGLGFIISRTISKPIKELVASTSKLAVGDTDVFIKSDSKDEIGVLVEHFNKMVNNIRQSAENVNKIAEGNLDLEIEVRSEKDILSKSMKKVAETLGNLISEMNNMSMEHDAGDIDIMVREDKFSGAYNTMAKGVNSMVKGHININKKAMGCVAEFAKGNFEAELEKFHGKKAFINNAIEELRSNLKEVNKEINELVIASGDGRLNERADVKIFSGDWAKLINGLNGLIDSINAPLNEAIAVLKRLAVNDYTTEMTGDYKGDLKNFADQINLVRTRLISVQDIAMRVSKGDLSRLEEFQKVGKRSENDKTLPAFTNMMEVIQDLIKESNILAKSAINGDLKTRGNEDNFHGGYKDVIAGINRTMEAFSTPIQEVSDVMQELSNGNLTVYVNGNYKGDYERMKEAVNFTIKSFEQVLDDINKSAEQVTSGARQVSETAQSLSQGSTEQASTLEELTSSIDSISSQTKQNATHASQASDFAISAKEDAITGNGQMKEMLKSMEDINQTSSNISKIIKVIDEIAFQTNILALNAAVEAARAGQHGKGFAVVAEEVRNLAARSADAAEETTTLIEGSIKKVESGTKIAQVTAGALDKIVDSVSKAANLVQDIARASNEQAVGISQVSQGISQVSHVVQSNSATSEESAAASEELLSQAEVLHDMVGKFQLSNNSALTDKYEQFAKKNKKVNRDNLNSISQVKDIKKKITLSDTEFDKY